MGNDELKNALECLLFVSDEPLTAAKAAQIVERSESETKKALDELAEDLRSQERGIQLRQVAGGYRFYTHPAYAPQVEKLIVSWDTRRLTQATLETLAIIAYKQPVTKVSINAVRGVNSDGAVASLSAKGLIKEMGREKSPGNPILYGTSRLFLEKFGLSSIKDLPPLADFEPNPSARGDIEAGLGE
jgi:segregation and condensation protein B